MSTPERGGYSGRLTGNVLAPALTNFDVSSTSVWSSNDARGVRFVAPKACKLQAVAFYVGVSSGNCDCAVYDTAPTTRAKLWSAGSTAVGTVNTWQVFNPVAAAGGQISFNEGDHFDVALAVDNATVSVGRLAAPTNAGVQVFAAPFLSSPQGGGANKLAWSIASTFPLTATLTESALVTTSAVIPHLIVVVS